jgi:hypothetical protein
MRDEQHILIREFQEFCNNNCSSFWHFSNLGHAGYGCFGKGGRGHEVLGRQESHQGRQDRPGLQEKRQGQTGLDESGLCCHCTEGDNKHFDPHGFRTGRFAKPESK